MSKRNDCNAVIQDTAESLGQIRDSNGTPEDSIVSAVLDIQRHAVTRSNWIKSLECLYLKPDRDDEPPGKRQQLAGGESIPSSYAHELLGRTHLDPVSDPEHDRDYVAVSYTWEASEEEKREAEEDGGCQDFGGYYVESRYTGQPAKPSLVRDVIWDRVLHYADHVMCEAIWIDRECIDQDNPREKEAAIQNMHMVYSFSRRPVALLTHTIQTVEALDLLVGLLLGDIREEEESATLDLLDKITSDLWWRRAWTFQEDYRASTRMTLLIPHTSHLEHRKRTARDASNRPLLGTLLGEICIKSTDFRRRATRFCLKYRQKQPEVQVICDKILATAGKYDVLLQEEQPFSPYPLISRSMTPTIFADIDRRGISVESDRLAIAANCCGYTTRLDTVALNKHSSSLSLSMLALYLLNGEIIKNQPQRRRGALKDTIFTYLAKQSLHSFRPPVDEKLTFIKGCRFVDPILTTDGTQTRGHLWRLGKLIRPRPLKRDRYCTLSPLDTLATDLQYRKYGKAYTELAVSLLAWSQDAAAAANRTGRHQCYTGRNAFAQARPLGWRTWMANEVEAALLEGKALRLASIVDPDNPDEYEPYSAIFVGDGADDWQEEEYEDDGCLKPSYVFTSVRPAKAHAVLGDTPRHVSLEVEITWPEADSDNGSDGESEDEDEDEPAQSQNTDIGLDLRPDTKKRDTEPGLPRLYIKRWLNGLCFWGGCPLREVLFPWPPELLATV
ncbi:heterokaryon incompatibility protein-domain-containing protein [Xylaria intraflava]|nr:heterokaryon incompatibility protein-domain-containing protein [Xylaria intraflava]